MVTEGQPMDEDHTHLIGTSLPIGEESRRHCGSNPLSDMDPCDLGETTGTENRTNLIVNYLPQTMSQEEMRAMFAKIGLLTSCKLIRDRISGQSLGYGFVNYANPQDAQLAIRTMNRMKVQNKTIKVSLARPSSESIKGANLYICGIPKSMSENQLEKLFQQCGKIITSRILYDNVTHQSKGVGFIRFDQRYEAELAIRKFNGHRVNSLQETPLVVKFANMPTSTKASTTHQTSTAAAITSDECSAGVPSLFSLLDLKKFGANSNCELSPSNLTNTLLLRDPNTELIDLLRLPGMNPTPSSLPVNSLQIPVSALEQHIRRTGGPVHSYSNYRLRYNPLDGCVVQLRVNPFDTNDQPLPSELNSFPVAAASLSLLPTFPELLDPNSNSLLNTVSPMTQTPFLLPAVLSNERIAANNAPSLWCSTMDPFLPVSRFNNVPTGDWSQSAELLNQFAPVIAQSGQNATKSLPLLLNAALSFPMENPSVTSHILNQPGMYGSPANGFHTPGRSTVTHANSTEVKLGPRLDPEKQPIVKMPRLCSLHTGSTVENSSQATGQKTRTSDVHLWMSGIAEQTILAAHYLNGCALENRTLDAAWTPLSSSAMDTTSISMTALDRLPTK